ncbi:hypothetical protein X777_02938 [Ooceraea biroi]|uniref:Uncharacterized protein n=1 Tax=Ooceraea biroi TaxID=2015173 RepID=A0A026WMH3_OOCBI|nr:hypothetical protein X777_02938 [Ooceraea biroi]
MMGALYFVILESSNPFFHLLQYFPIIFTVNSLPGNCTNVEHGTQSSISRSYFKNLSIKRSYFFNIPNEWTNNVQTYEEVDFIGIRCRIQKAYSTTQRVPEQFHLYS